MVRTVEILMSHKYDLWTGRFTKRSWGVCRPGQEEVISLCVEKIPESVKQQKMRSRSLLYSHRFYILPCGYKNSFKNLSWKEYWWREIISDSNAPRIPLLRDNVWIWEHSWPTLWLVVPSRGKVCVRLFACKYSSNWFDRRQERTLSPLKSKLSCSKSKKAHSTLN